MKRIIRFFVVCLAWSAFQTGSVDAANNVRNGQKRDNSKTVSAFSSRSVSATQKNDLKKSDVSRTTAKTVKAAPQTQNDKKNVVSRSDSAKTVVKSRNNSHKTSAKTSNINNARSTTSRSAKTISAPATKNSSTRNAVYSRASKRNNIIRATELDTEKASAIKSKDYSKCKTVFYECMDEFCANKDANLRRCSCSTRVHEFDKIKKQLSDAEDKMLDFNQRLLIVNLDKEDAAAINVASEGELAFEKKDSSESEKLLKKITDALNTSGDSKINNNLSSLSLDMDSAWDSVDSLSGVATTSKNGVELYNAALPVCLEMAKEICSDEELDIAQSGYKLTIQQDCNTVAKSYSSQYNNAMNKIHESGALLDMARLNAYQQRNSDDVLTCKKKMLEQLSDESVCGKNLYKCLDTTGQYINPSTGEAFLSENLYNLSTLLTTPAENETWAKVGQNDKFVSFLTTKKKFLESAMEQCQDMADTIWKEFIGDALAQIKLAQNSKLEEVRQSCTKLIAECKISGQETLADFDSRALSTFSVIADTTVNALCADVETSCVSLLNQYGDVKKEWEQGIKQIAADISYEKIKEACTTVGQNCIIQQCNGTSGNFALCEDSASSPRRAILKRQACWKEVENCVKQAGNIESISAEIITNRSNFYKNTYDLESIENIPTFCANNDKACLLTELIWGNCQHGDDVMLVTGLNSDLTGSITINNITYNFEKQNKILTSSNISSLLSWFADNTGTIGKFDSCNTSTCPVNYAKIGNNCSLIEKQGNIIDAPEGETVYFADYVIEVPGGIKNHCSSGVKDYWGNCCESGKTHIASYANTSFPVCVPDGYKALPVQTATCPTNSGSSYECSFANEQLLALCITQSNTVEYRQGGSSTNPTNVLMCDGHWIIIDERGKYINPGACTVTSQHFGSYSAPIVNCAPLFVEMTYHIDTEKQTYYHKYSSGYGGFGWFYTHSTIPGTSSLNLKSSINDPYKFMIKYNLNN